MQHNAGASHRKANMRPAFWRPARWFILLLLAGLLLAGGSVWSALGTASSEPEPLVWEVARSDFLHEIPVRGELESTANTEVRCEVRSGDGWIRILEVVEEGKYVKPGDFLVRLDSSALEAERNQQELECARAEAVVIAARNHLASAEAAQRAYLEGEFPLEQKVVEAEIGLCREAVRKAHAFLAASRRLAARGFLTPQQLAADQYAARAAETGLRIAETKLHVLIHASRVRRLAELESDVAIAKARLAAAEHTLQLQRHRLAEIEEQIRKCEVRAPVAGPVVLAHLHHYGHSHMIQPGEETRENRALVRLPDPARMRIKAKLSEEAVAAVRRGQRARVHVDAFPHAVMRGTVLHVNEFPEPSEWFMSGIKEYMAFVSIEDPIPGLRPGMTVNVWITIEQAADQIQVPLQAVVRHGGRDYCIGVGRSRLLAREVLLGPNDGRMVVVQEGLEAGERVLLLPRVALGRVALPGAAKPAPRDFSTQPR